MNLLFIINGSIAILKAVELVREISKSGTYNIKVIMTKSASDFVTKLTVEALTASPVYEYNDHLDEQHLMTHIELARWPDKTIVVPATANFMAKCAAGFADDLASSVLLTTTKPIFMAPAMNPTMWLHPATQSNFNTLTERGTTFILPEQGKTACGESGQGRLAGIDKIIKVIDT